MLLTQGRRDGGMTVLRGQSSFSTWEIDQLLVEPASHDMCAELLARADALVPPIKGLRMFLRLTDDSPVAQASAEAGYRRYLTEDVLGAPADLDTSRALRFRLAPDLDVRSRRQEDDYPLFRLYTAATPVPVRALEGLTFREWQEATAVRWQGTSRLHDVVMAQEGRLVGWLRTATTSSGHVLASMFWHPDVPDAADAITREALTVTRETHRLRLLIPTHDTALTDRFEEAGFGRIATYTSLVHQGGERLLEGAFVPAGS